MQTSERADEHDDVDTTKDHKQSDQQPADDGTTHTTEGDAATASASDADAGDLTSDTTNDEG